MPVTISLEGKTALVTGGSQGIGASIARTLAQAGAHVAVAARTLEKAREVADAIGASGGSAEAVSLDVAEPISVTAAFRTLLESRGRIDIVVNNAGITA
ncbi:MAG: SDR family NAD(P)-dependent oxidoreductase, partial [Thermoanaerobaculia bacterium]